MNKNKRPAPKIVDTTKPKTSTIKACIFQHTKVPWKLDSGEFLEADRTHLTPTARSARGGQQPTPAKPRPKNSTHHVMTYPGQFPLSYFSGFAHVYTVTTCCICGNERIMKTDITPKGVAIRTSVITGSIKSICPTCAKTHVIQTPN